MTASSYSGLRHAKPRPRALDKADKRREREAKDRAENAKVRRRSGGRCEVIEVFERFIGSISANLQCTGQATDPHHLIGGSGRRNVGRSILAAHKLHVCRRCHDAITGHVLDPSSEDAATVTFTRRR